MSFYYTGSRDNTLLRVKKTDGVTDATRNFGSVNPRGVAYHDGFVYVAGDNSTLYKLDAETLTVDSSTSHSTGSANFAAYYDGNVYIGGFNNRVDVHSASDLSFVGSYSGHSSTVWDIAFIGEHFFSCGADNKIHKVKISGLSKQAEFSDTNALYAIDSRNDYLYAGGDSRILYKILSNDLSTAESKNISYQIRGIALSGKSVFVSTKSSNRLRRHDPDTLDLIEDLSQTYGSLEWDGEVLVYVASDSSTSKVWSSGLDQISSNTDHSDFIWDLATEPYIEPPDDEEVFEASFEDASGRDPLPTALIERTPAKNLANHNVTVYKHPPYIVTKRLPIELDDYGKTLPGNMIWHKDSNDALFSMGRWAQIQGRRFTDNPTEVELTLRISDHTESFEEPT